MNSNIKYEVTARKKSDSTLDEDKVKLYLTEVDGNEQGILLDKYSNLDQTNTKVPDGVVEKTIYEGEVPANTNYEKNFRLRMWIDNDTDFSGGGGSSYIANPLLTNRVMYCYNCQKLTEEQIKTISTTCTNKNHTENCSKQGNGYAKITYLGR